MQAICDIYLLDDVSGASLLLRQLRIFNSAFTFDEKRSYTGFLGLDVGRLKAVAILTHFRHNGIRCINIPTRYRCEKRMSEIEARQYAERFVQGKGAGVHGPVRPQGINPMHWHFRADLGGAAQDGHPREGGGILTIDSLDGHVWDDAEMEEYQYDYNNVF